MIEHIDVTEHCVKRLGDDPPHIGTRSYIAQELFEETSKGRPLHIALVKTIPFSRLQGGGIIIYRRVIPVSY